MEGLKGIGVSPGVVVGPAVLLIQNARLVYLSIAPDRIDQEVARLHAACDRSRTQLDQIKRRLGSSAGAELAGLFDAQMLMLDDPMLVARAVDTIGRQHVNAEWAIQSACDELSGVLDRVDDPYLRERKGDLADVVGRLRMNLRQKGMGPREFLKDIDIPCVLIADDLTPSLVAQLDWSRIQGFASDSGTRTSHTAIIARSLQVPAIVGLHDASARVPAGATVVIDATSDVLIINPTPDYLQSIEARVRSSDGRKRSHASPESEPAWTIDGLRIRLEANVEHADDTVFARAQGAEGIGLYRSEFLLASAPADLVTEDVQFEEYRRMLERMAPGPVTVRTFDVDEDQLASRLRTPRAPDEWPSVASDHTRGRLGLRAIRLSTRRRELLRQQLRALLRAAAHGPLRIMFPFVSGVDEIREARSVLAEAAQELTARGVVVPSVPVGAMIEVPSAAFTADLIAPEVDFFTIGTNDLIQCCLAVDRTDDRVSHLYEPLHPAILRLIRSVRRAAGRRGIPVSLCGEMAADPMLLALLIGLGLTGFSMAPSAIPAARHAVRRLHAGELRRVAGRVLRLSSVPDIEACLNAALGPLSQQAAAAGEE